MTFFPLKKLMFIKEFIINFHFLLTKTQFFTILDTLEILYQDFFLLFLYKGHLQVFSI